MKNMKLDHNINKRKMHKSKVMRYSNQFIKNQLRLTKQLMVNFKFEYYNNKKSL